MIYNDLLLARLDYAHDKVTTYNANPNLSKVYPMNELRQSMADY